MSLSHKTTLLQEADVDAVQTYIDTLMSSHRDSVTKREALVYLKRILNSDSAVVRELQRKLTRMNSLISKHSSRQELAGQSDVTHLFTADSRTVDQLIQVLQADNGILYGVNYTFDNTVFAPLMSNETKFVVQGNNVRFLGESNEQSAKTQDLSCSCVVKAPIHFKPKTGATEITNVVIDGVHFIPNSAQVTVTTETKVKNLTFINCIFDGVNHNTSQCIWGSGQALEGTLTLKNCIIKNYGQWGYMDPTTASGTPTKQLELVDIQDCLFLNNKGSMAFRTVQDPTSAGFLEVTETFQFINNKIDVSGLLDLHEYYWSCVECNNFEKIIVKNNEAQGIRASSAGHRGFLQVWSKGPDMILEIENNTLTDFNIGYQLAFGGEPGNAAVFKGCSSDSYVTMRQNDLTRVDHTHKLVYPWLSSTAVVNISGSGVLPTITTPNSEDDLTTNDYPLIETFTATSETNLENHIFQLGNNTTGYIQVNSGNTQLYASSWQWFNLKVQSNVLASQPHKLWQDTMISDFKVVEQERSFDSSGIMEKRCHLGENVTANSTFLKLYFKIE